MIFVIYLYILWYFTINKRKIIENEHEFRLNVPKLNESLIFTIWRLNFIQYLWSQVFVVPGVLAIAFYAIIKYNISEYLYNNKIIKLKLINYNILIYNLMLETTLAMSVTEIIDKELQNDATYATIGIFELNNLPIIDKYGSIINYHNVIIKINLTTKEWISTKSNLYDYLLPANTTCVIIYFHLAFINHVQMHAYINWNVKFDTSNSHLTQENTQNTQKVSEKTQNNSQNIQKLNDLSELNETNNEFLNESLNNSNEINETIDYTELKTMSTLNVIYNDFGSLGFINLSKFLYNLGFITNIYDKINEIFEYACKTGISGHTNVYKLLKYSKFVSFLIKLRPIFIKKYNKYNKNYFDSNYETYFVTLIHSIDHYQNEKLMNNNILCLKDDTIDQMFAAMIPMCRLAYATTSTEPFLLVNHKYNQLKHVFFNEIYIEALKIDKEFANQIEGCIAR